VLKHQKKKILTSISGKYCKILDEMFDDLGASIMSSMMKYKDANWEWHAAQEVIDAYNKEKAFKDSLCAVENSADESTESFITVILNEINMSQQKLKVIYLKTNSRFLSCIVASYLYYFINHYNNLFLFVLVNNEKE